MPHVRECLRYHYRATNAFHSSSDGCDDAAVALPGDDDILVGAFVGNAFREDIVHWVMCIFCVVRCGPRVCCDAYRGAMMRRY